MATPPICFLPGPTEVDPELREIMARPVVGHRSPEFVATVHAVREGLRAFFLTRAHTLVENCPATALMEAAVRNLVRRRVLHLVCGAFGERWVKISRACGREVEERAVPWGRPVTPAALRETLEACPPVEAVAVTFNETSTGCLNPLPELAAILREVAPDALLLVDAVSGVGGAELRFDEWGLDLALAGTQKCLALPPGLTVFALSERALSRAREVERRGYFWDFVRAAEWMAEGKVTATPCVPLVFALARQLERIAAEGMERRWRRHAAMRAEVEGWAGRTGFEYLVDRLHRSPTVSCLKASGRDVAALIDRARAAGYVLGNGYGKLKGETFRIGHMGDHTVERLRGLLDALAC